MRVQILAINDFHGHLEPPSDSGGFVLASASDPVASAQAAQRTDAGAVLVLAGGAAYLATHVAQLRRQNANTVVVSAGDLTGASPLLSNLFQDEPVILVMNRLGLTFEAVGNHDFDRGIAELLRLQHGGCRNPDCDAGTFAGASFTYLAANTIDVATGRPLFPPYAIRDFDGARVAFVGETLVQTPSVTVPAAVTGLRFADEASTVNALVPELEAQGVSAIVLRAARRGIARRRRDVRFVRGHPRRSSSPSSPN